jgi:hypothetical protein
MRITLPPLHLSNYDELNAVKEFRLHVENLHRGYDSMTSSDVIGTADFMSPFLFPILIVILSLSSPPSHWNEFPIGLRLIRYIAWYINDR